MSFDQILVCSILIITIGLFLWGRWRHDVVALAGLMACVLTGLVPAEDAFSGFSHPAVITVAAVLILSHGLQSSGAIEAVAQRVLPSKGGAAVGILALMLFGALLSAFMNNVGAMALLMPLAMQVAVKHDLPPGKVLMPLAFSTILGGMTTLIGTPPNLIVSSFRAETVGSGFSMFSFSPVGVSVMLAGLVFIALAGRWLIPTRRKPSIDSFDTGNYLTEVRVREEAKVIGSTLGEVEHLLDEVDAQIVGMARNDFRVTAPYPGRVLREGDILVIESDPQSLGSTLTRLGLKLEESVMPEPEDKDKDKDESEEIAESAPEPETNLAQDASSNNRTSEIIAEDEHNQEEAEEPEEESSVDDSSSAQKNIAIQELVVQPGAQLIGRSASDVQIRSRFGINLLAISRQGDRSIRRLRWTPLFAGDVLLMQGPEESIASFAAALGCIPLAQRSILIPSRRKAITSVVIMALAVALAAFGLLPTAIAFSLGVLAYMLTNIIPLRRIYEAIDWPIIVLLGSLIPLAGAMATTGAADLLAKTLLEQVAQGNAIVALTLLLVTTMMLSDFMNNAATAAVMSPIALSIASQLQVNPDSFLMAVAIGASCAFLTPIGHQNNTLILGPGGFRFGDYWRLGLPLEIVVTLVAIPMLLWIWPL